MKDIELEEWQSLSPFIRSVRTGLVVHIRDPGATARQIRPNIGRHLFRSDNFSGRNPGKAFPGSRNGGHWRVVLCSGGGEGALRGLSCGDGCAIGGDAVDCLGGSLWMGRHLVTILQVHSKTLLA